MNCSVFKDIFDKNNPHNISVKGVLYYIKSGRWQNKIEKIRLTTEPEERKRLKNFLPSICFSGTFKSRFDNQLIEHSGFVILDFDHVENLHQLKSELCKDKFTYSCFVSPSGDGLKVLVKIPADKDAHRDHYRGLMEKYPSLDSTSINISRVCFASYDPDLYLNEQSETWTKRKKYEAEKQTTFEAQDTNYKKIQIAVDMIRDSVDGEKHRDLIKAARLLGGFIAGGSVEEHEAVRALEIEINKKGILDFKQAQKTIHDGIEHGKKNPIYDSNEKQSVKAIKEELIIIEGEPARDVIYLEDIRENIVYSFENGSSRGETTHFDAVDIVFRMARKELTVFYGLANHGKSTFALQLALLKSYFSGYKWGIFSPENYPAEEFYKDLIHMFVGKSTEKHHKNQMTKVELNRAMDFVREYIYFMYPEKDSPTPDYINMRFREMIIKHNIDGCIIDPYNQLDTDISNTGGKEHLYLSKFLSGQKKFSVDHNVFMWIITHPRGDVTLNKNNYDMPKAYSLSGGAMWMNKSDNIICVHRPNFANFEDQDVIIASQKIKKQKLNGIPGEVLMKYDRYANRYYHNEFTPFEEKREKPSIQANINFYEPKTVQEDEQLGIEGEVPF